MKTLLIIASVMTLNGCGPSETSDSVQAGSTNSDDGPEDADNPKYDFRGHWKKHHSLEALRGRKDIKRVFLMECKDVGDREAEVLGTLSELRDLNLNGTGIKDAGAKKLHALKNLEVLSLLYTDTSDASLQGIERLENLKELAVGRSVTVRGLLSLKQLKKLERLTVRTKIGLQGYKAIGELKSLRHFDCWYDNDLNDEGLSHLSNLTQLESLGFGCAWGVTDEGIKHLTKLKKLKELHAYSTRVSNAAIPDLSKIQTLEHFCAGLSGMTRKGADELQRRVPKLKSVDMGD